LEGAGNRVAFLADEDALLEAQHQPLDTAAIDDVDRLGEAGQGALFSLYNRLRESGGVVVAAGPVPPAQLRLRADVVTRLAWGLTFEVHALSDAEKAHALADHAAHRGFGLPPDVFQYLLTHAARDMRTLVALVESLDRYSLETKRAVTVPLLRELLALRT
jgi:DnaA-homolog protein